MIAIYLTLITIGSSACNWGFETSQSYIFSIVPDNDGTVWCATAGGIIHYDPQNGWLSSYLYPDQLPWISATDLIIDDSLMWVATGGGGLALLQGDAWQVFSAYEGVPGLGYVYSVYSGGGFIWAGTDGGLARGNSEGFLPIDSDLTGGAFNASEVTDIAGIGNTMYLATDRGVYSVDLGGSVFNPQSWTSYSDATIDLGIDDIYIASADSVFGYGSGGVSQRIDEDKWVRLLDYSSSADSVVTGLLVTADGLIAGCKKIILYDNGNWEYYGTGYPEASYASCLSEISGRIWCGYGSWDESCKDTGNGLGYLDNGTWKNITVPGMGCSNCYQIALDEDRVYIGSHHLGLLANYPDSGWRAFNMLTVDMPRSLRTYTAAKSDCSGIWTGSYHWGLTWIDDRGTYSMEDDTIITYVSDSLPDVSTHVVQIVSPLLNNQVVMLASQGSALLVAQKAYWQTPDEPSGITAVSGEPEQGNLQWTTRTEKDGLASKNIQTVYPCGQDSLWIAFASEGGCQLLVHGGDPMDKSSDTWYPGYGQVYDASWGLPSNQVFCFAGNADGDIFAGTGNGLCRWNGSVFVEVTGIAGSVKAMQVGNDGVIWCMTENAIYSVAGSDVTEFTGSNSIYMPTSRTENEFSSINPENGTISFSSLIGLWSISPHQNHMESPDLLFYPQPYLPSEEELHIVWSGTAEPVSVKFFSLTGEYLGSVQADSWEEWTWDGTLDGALLASGVYIVIVETDSDTIRSRIAVVR
ncbi:MAG: T9SS type A sorting domain-containing protein [Candidatus Aegiribacteria sp.]|nr:T9SS type A sorting domain-containing protein [Candidatus Aegiribacteria sp.]